MWFHSNPSLLALPTLGPCFPYGGSGVSPGRAAILSTAHTLHPLPPAPPGLGSIPGASPCTHRAQHIRAGGDTWGIPTLSCCPQHSAPSCGKPKLPTGGDKAGGSGSRGAQQGPQSWGRSQRSIEGGGGERGCSECAGLGVSHSGARRVTGSAGHHCAAEKFLLSGSYGAAAAGGAPAGGGVTPSAGGGGCAAGGYMPLGAARGTRGPMRPPAMGAMPGGAAAPAG